MNRFTLFVLALVLFFGGSVLAQPARLIQANDPEARLVERLQRRGFLLNIHPTAWPHTARSISQTVSRATPLAHETLEKAWLHRLKDYLEDDREVGHNRLRVRAEGNPGIRTANTARLDPLRPVNNPSATVEANGLYVYPFTQANLSAGNGPWVAHAGVRGDIYYNDDVDSYDTGKRLMARNESSYLGVDTRIVSAYLGRFYQRWGSPTGSTLILGDRARSFDQLTVRFGGERLSLRSFAADLDDVLAPDYIFDGRVGSAPDTATVVRRYLTGHRLDWRPSRNVALSLQETTVFSGPGLGLSPVMMIPTITTLFLTDNAPKDAEHNGLIGASVWARTGRVVLEGQVLLDDFVTPFSSNDPASIGLSGRVSVADILKNVDGIARGELITARTYNATQPPGKYIYARSGIGAAFSDYAFGEVSGTVYLENQIPGLVLEPYVAGLVQGEGDPRADFPNNDAPTLFIGAKTRTARLGTRVEWTPNRYFSATLDGGVNRVWNADHIPGESRTEAVVLFGLSARIGTSTTTPLELP